MKSHLNFWSLKRFIPCCKGNKILSDPPTTLPFGVPFSSRQHNPVRWTVDQPYTWFPRHRKGGDCDTRALDR